MTPSTVETPRNTSTERATHVAEFRPAVDIYENDKELLVVADLPRVTPNSLKLEVNHPEMKIEGRAVASDTQPEYVYTRTFHLDSSVDVSKIEANLSEGVLQVHLPKSEPYRVRRIEVKTA
jgi:HSP20 family molecular chaperone IbpA